ncbi:MAG: hypothetical protein MRZ79_26410 [Bacteroidia bacterium]|nr:hypothetical protein [Bacteroidia bacterium]
MATEKKFQPVFESLSKIFHPHKDKLIVLHDNESNFYLDCPGDPFKKGRPHFFGAATIKKSYVSFHLMPVYTHPDLLDGMTEGLKKRMQGKSCFNFKKVEPGLFEELERLTAACFNKYLEVGYIH